MSDYALECCYCGHEYREAEAKRIPDPERWMVIIRVCPQCDCPDYYMNEVKEEESEIIVVDIIQCNAADDIKLSFNSPLEAVYLKDYRDGEAIKIKLEYWPEVREQIDKFYKEWADG